MKPYFKIILCLCVAMLAACESFQKEGPDNRPIHTRYEASMLDAAAQAERRGKYDTALGYYRSAYERDSGNVEATLGLARNLRRVLRAREAMVIAERGLEVHKRHPQLMAELGKAQLDANDTLNSIETLSRAGSFLPKDWEIQSAIGVGFDRLGMYDQAVHRYENALAIAPGNAVVLNNLALSLAQSGQLAQAIAMLEKATSSPRASSKAAADSPMKYRWRAFRRTVARRETGSAPLARPPRMR